MLLLQTQSLGRNRPDRRIQHHYAADCGTHHRPYCINANSLPQHCNQATFAQIFIVAGVAKRRIGQDFTEPFLHELSGVLTVHLTNYRDVA